MKLNVQRFKPDAWVLNAIFSDYKYNTTGRLIQVTLKITSNYNIGSVYDIDSEDNENWAYSLWNVHNGVGTYPYSEVPYIERTFYNLNDLKGVKVTTYETSSTQNKTITYNFEMDASGEEEKTTYITKTSATAVLKGNVLNNLNTYDYNNAPSVAAVRNYLDSGGIIRGDGVNKIVYMDDFSQYQQLQTEYRIDNNTEYHIAENESSYSNLESYIQEIILRAHPIGSIELNITGDNPSTYLGGTWIQVSQGRAIFGEGTCSTTYNVNGTSQTYSNTYTADTNYAAGLPNIEGTGHYADNNASWSGALYQAGTANYIGDGSASGTLIGLQASRNRAIYGRSNTVQPNAYVVYVWKRTA